MGRTSAAPLQLTSWSAGVRASTPPRRYQWSSFQHQLSVGRASLGDRSSPPPGDAPPTLHTDAPVQSQNPRDRSSPPNTLSTKKNHKGARAQGGYGSLTGPSPMLRYWDILAVLSVLSHPTIGVPPIAPISPPFPHAPRTCIAHGVAQTICAPKAPRGTPVRKSIHAEAAGWTWSRAIAGAGRGASGEHTYEKAQAPGTTAQTMEPAIFRQQPHTPAPPRHPKIGRAHV